MVNKGHLDEAGLEIPTEWTWDDYRDYAKAMTTDEHYGSYLTTQGMIIFNIEIKK